MHVLSRAKQALLSKKSEDRTSGRNYRYSLFSFFFSFFDCVGNYPLKWITKEGIYSPVSDIFKYGCFTEDTT